jgi:hypothetical protein
MLDLSVSPFIEVIILVYLIEVVGGYLVGFNFKKPYFSF